MQNIEKIYEEYFKTVYKYLVYLTRDIDISEELTQETFCIAIKNINKFNNDCKISVWLCQIAKHLWFKELKKIKKVSIVSDNEISIIEDGTDILYDLISNDNKLNIYKNIQKLDEKTREVIYLKLMGDLDYKEIGEILNKNETWARVIFYRGKKKLKEVNENGKTKL